MSTKIQIVLVSIVSVMLFGLVLLLRSEQQISPGKTGVLITLGEVQDDYLAEGLNWVNPFWDDVIEIDTRIRKHEIDCEAGSKDLQQIKAIIAVNYRFIQVKVPEIYQSIGNEESFEVNILTSAIHESVKAVIAKYDAEELLKERSDVRKNMENALKLKLDNILQDAFIVSAFNIIDFDFTDVFNKAIETKTVAAEKAKQSINEIVQERAEADKKIETARGKAESVKLIASASAAAIIVEAEARARAIFVEGKVLRDNPQILRLRAIERWNGALPRVITGETTGIELVIGK